MKESDLVYLILKALKAEGGFWVKIHGGAYQVSGLPDIIGCYKGRFVALEVKMPGRLSTLSKRQRLVLSRVRHSGGTAAVVVDVQGALEVVRRLDAQSD